MPRQNKKKKTLDGLVPSVSIDLVSQQQLTEGLVKIFQNGPKSNPEDLTKPELVNLALLVMGCQCQLIGI